MPRKHPGRALEPARARIATKVRALRLGRGWTLLQLAEQVHISKSRLSEIERGHGSFTAEQFLLILKLFNVPTSHFTDEARDQTGQLQNALARLGASHLYESRTRTPSDELADPYVVIRETLLDGSPRLIAALAPVLTSQPISGSRLLADTGGLYWRLGWVVENTLVAIDTLLVKSPRNLELLQARLRLSSLLEALQEHTPVFEDMLDPTIRTQRTLDSVREASSEISKRWRIASSIQPDDFVRALKAARAAD